MSRVGMLPVEVPDGVDFQIDGALIKPRVKWENLRLKLAMRFT